MEGLGSKRALVLAFAVDLLISLAAYLVTFRLRFIAGPLPAYNWIPFTHALPILVLIALFSHALFGVYQRHVTLEEAQAAVLTSSFATLIATMAASYVLNDAAIPRSVLVVAPILQGLALVGSRRLLSGTFQAPSIRLITPGDLNPAVFVAEVGKEEMRVVPDPALVLLTGASLARSENFRLELALPTVGFGAGDRVLKRGEDLLLAIVLLVPALVLGCLIALGILLDDGFPVLYGQRRVGRLGGEFWIWKFRSMNKQASRQDDGTLASPSDPRLTRFGRLLRRSRLDELPQLWNIFRGEMSFVGPRPERPEWVHQFAAQNPYYLLRLRVKPGVSGLAQLYGTYDLPADEKLKYDLYYLTRHSLALDILILLRTLAVPLQPEKAVGQRPGADPVAPPLTKAADEKASDEALSRGRGGVH